MQSTDIESRDSRFVDRGCIASTPIMQCDEVRCCAPSNTKRLCQTTDRRGRIGVVSSGAGNPEDFSALLCLPIPHTPTFTRWTSWHDRPPDR